MNAYMIRTVAIIKDENDVNIGTRYRLIAALRCVVAKDRNSS